MYVRSRGPGRSTTGSLPTHRSGATTSTRRLPDRVPRGPPWNGNHRKVGLGGVDPAEPTPEPRLPRLRNVTIRRDRGGGRGGPAGLLSPVEAGAGTAAPGRSGQGLTGRAGRPVEGQTLPAVQDSHQTISRWPSTSKPF